MRSHSQAYFSGGEYLAGLGDAVVMSPIVHKISKDYDKVYFPARHSNVEDTIRKSSLPYPNILTAIFKKEQNHV